MSGPEPKHRARSRRYPVHGMVSFPGKPLVVIVTACTLKRVPWLATSEVHLILRDAWTDSDDWLVGCYVVMPDHVHLFASPRNENSELGAWIRHWKSYVSNRVDDKTKRSQRDYWDRRLRSHESYEQKWDYVSNNPVRHELVERAEDWPYQGEINTLDW